MPSDNKKTFCRIVKLAPWVLGVVFAVASGWTASQVAVDSLKDSVNKIEIKVEKKADTTAVDKAFRQQMELIDEKFKSLEAQMDLKFEAADSDMKLRFDNFEKLLKQAVNK